MRLNPGISEADLAHCESMIGCSLPTWLRARLLHENGWQLDDTIGVTGMTWRFLPVLDRSDRKRRSRTAEDIAWHTARMRAEADVPAGAVVVARSCAETTRLILLPDADDPTRLGPMLRRQNGHGAALDQPIDHRALGRLPEPVPGSKPRSREALPAFPYHPDPLATGSIRHNPGVVCPCCEQATGWEFTMRPYGLGEQPAHLCPWCIADGSAHSRFGSEFVSDIAGAPIPDAIAETINLRTPGYLSWQGEQWQTCCSDAAVFLGGIGWEQLQSLPDACQSLIADGWPEDALPLMRADGDLTAYLFQCRHCGRHLAHADAC